MSESEARGKNNSNDTTYWRQETWVLGVAKKSSFLLSVVAMVVTAGKIVCNGIICSAALVKISVIVQWLGFFDWVDI